MKTFVFTFYCIMFIPLYFIIVKKTIFYVVDFVAPKWKQIQLLICVNREIRKQRNTQGGQTWKCSIQLDYSQR